jgi:hypothetical protein
MCAAVYDLLWVIGLVMSFFSAFVYFWHIRPAWILFLVRDLLSLDCCTLK